MIDITKHLPASMDAIRQEANAMFAELDRQRARMFVQQIANKHGDDDVCELRPDPDTKEPTQITYKERAKELDDFEQNLRDGLPPTIVEAISQNGKAD